MSLVFLESFNSYAGTGSISAANTKWTSVNTFYVESGKGSNGTNAGRLFIGGSWARKVVPSQTGYVMGASVSPQQNGDAITQHQGGIMQFRNTALGNAHLTLNVTDAGYLNVRRGDSEGTLLQQTPGPLLKPNVYYYIEFKATIDPSAGSFEVRLNQQTILSMTGVNTSNGGASAITEIGLGGRGSSATGTGTGWPSYVDDVYFCDFTGSVNNTFLGGTNVIMTLPIGDGIYQQGVPSTGTTHWNLVDEVPPTATDYVSLVNTGDQDSYVFANVTPPSGAICGTQVSAFMDKSDNLNSRGSSLFIESGGVNQYGSNANLTTTAGYIVSVFESDPANSLPWTFSALNIAQPGAEAT